MDAIKKHILIDTPTRKKICKAMSCSTVQVWKALTFRSDSANAKRIRMMALESGGVMVGNSGYTGDDSRRGSTPRVPAKYND